MRDRDVCVALEDAQTAQSSGNNETWRQGRRCIHSSLSTRYKCSRVQPAAAGHGGCFYGFALVQTAGSCRQPAGEGEWRQTQAHRSPSVLGQASTRFGAHDIDIIHDGDAAQIRKFFSANLDTGPETLQTAYGVVQDIIKELFSRDATISDQAESGTQQAVQMAKSAQQHPQTTTDALQKLLPCIQLWVDFQAHVLDAGNKQIEYEHLLQSNRGRDDGQPELVGAKAVAAMPSA